MRNALEQLSFKFSRALFVTKKEFFLCFICFVYVIKSYWNIHDTIFLNSILFLNWLNLEDKGTCVWQIIYTKFERNKYFIHLLCQKKKIKKDQKVLGYGLSNKMFVFWLFATVFEKRRRRNGLQILKTWLCCPIYIM